MDFMDRVILLTGKVETTRGMMESYQLVIGGDYIFATYGGFERREQFYDETSRRFARRILEESQSLEVGVSNGLRINPQTGNIENLSKLEEGSVKQLIKNIYTRLSQNSTGEIIIPVPPVVD